MNRKELTKMSLTLTEWLTVDVDLIKQSNLYDAYFS